MNASESPTSLPGDGLTVALCAPAWPPGSLPNGIVAYVEHLAPALRALGARVFVLSGELTSDSDPWAREVTVPRGGLPRRIFERLWDTIQPEAAARRRAAIALAAAIEQLDIDLVEIEESFGWCGELMERCDVPVVARLHGPWFLNGPMVDDPTSRGFARRVAAEGDALQKLTAVSSPARDVLDRTRAHYHLPLADAAVIHNPVAQYPPEQRWRREAAHPKTLLFVGRFDGHKGGDVVIDAFARVRLEQPEVRLIFAGPDRGFTASDGRRWSVEDYADHHLVRPEDRAAIDILGPLRPERVTALRCEAALTVVASRYEIFGYTLTEAMAQGCPIVSTAAGGLPEILEDGESGILVTPGDPEALAEGILRLLRDPDEAERLGARAAERARRLSPDTIAAETIAFYRTVVPAREQR